MSAVPFIKETQRESHLKSEYDVVIAMQNSKFVPQTYEHRHSYRGLKIAFVASIVWLCGFAFVISFLPVIPPKGHALLGFGMITLVLVNFVVEMCWGGGKDINRSGMGGY